MRFELLDRGRQDRPNPHWSGSCWQVSKSAEISHSDPLARRCSAVRGVFSGRMPLTQRARSRETPLSNRSRVGPPRSPSSSSDAPRSRNVACVPCSRTSEPIRLSSAVGKSGHTTGSKCSRRRTAVSVRKSRPQTRCHRSWSLILPNYYHAGIIRKRNPPPQYLNVV